MRDDPTCWLSSASAWAYLLEVLLEGLCEAITLDGPG